MRAKALTWNRRRTVTRNELGTFARRWESARSYCVVERTSNYGVPGFRFLAIEVTGYGECIVSRHRTEAAAKRALEKRSRQRATNMRRAA